MVVLYWALQSEGHEFDPRSSTIFFFLFFSETDCVSNPTRGELVRNQEVALHILVLYTEHVKEPWELIRKRASGLYPDFLLSLFLDDKINVEQNLKLAIGQVRKHCGKRRKCWLTV